jgi:hypothetical protein
MALRQAIDMIEGLRYMLRMMGIPIDGGTKVYCDNDSIVKATTRTEFTLKKKHNAINYHRICEAQAAGHIRIGWIDGKKNLADALMKVTVGALVILKDFVVIRWSSLAILESRSVPSCGDY